MIIGAQLYWRNNMNLAELQKKLKKTKYDAYLISRNNIYIDQDIRDDENTLMQLTNFTGSAGTLIITEKKCFLFVDGRYELQAQQQVNPNDIDVICTTNISMSDWITQNLLNAKIGYNPWCWTIKDILKIKTATMIADEQFLPYTLTSKKIKLFEHDIAHCGTSREEKLSLLSEEIKNKQLQAYFISSSDSVSWLMNLRSTTLPNTPVFRSFAIVDTKRHIWIFSDNVDDKKINTQLTYLPISELASKLKKFKGQTIGFDFNHTSAAIFNLCQKNNINVQNIPDICQEHKSIKNECELFGIRNAHIRDGISLCKFLFWLENNWKNKTELDVVNKLHELRAKNTNFVSESFSTIAAFGPNGAIVHYSPTNTTNKKLERGNFILLDSGAQYYDGTTDVTRTIVIDSISTQMSEDFTLVLKSHIALNSAIFPQNTSGARLDAIARQIMWKEGKNYNHGTGHGVGCFLNVHEGPQYISPLCNQPIKAQQITSIEPGYYLENQYGIRIENMVEVCPAQYQGYLKFKNLTLVPIDNKAINKYLLTTEEIEWLNNYHQEVYNNISPYLTEQEQEWLLQACSPL